MAKAKRAAKLPHVVVTTGGDRLRDALRSILSAAKPMHEHLEYVLIEVSATLLTYVITDGHRLCVYEQEHGNKLSKSTAAFLLLPLHLAKSLVEQAKWSPVATLCFGTKPIIQLSGGPSFPALNKTAGKKPREYPPWRKVVPSKGAPPTLPRSVIVQSEYLRDIGKAFGATTSGQWPPGITISAGKSELDAIVFTSESVPQLTIVQMPMKSLKSGAPELYRRANGARS